ncbi:DNA cytosine methyltransferase [Paeniglutamicibacter sp. ORCA_105]|uniref:DNA cytosine methyltransferase n=1 Tax=Paeniglutamicibacter sp. ORCA_105 TaxID=3377336 RepID=UPI0038963C9A
MSKIPFISLFSGAMGLDLGLEKAGFETRVCVENDVDAGKTIRTNRPNLPHIGHSIVDVSGETLIERSGITTNVPLVVGGPPCQAFSVFGKRQGLSDTRGQMLLEYVRVVDEVNPEVFVMENVRGLLSMSLSTNKEAAGTPEGEKGSLLKYVFEQFAEIGYRVDCFVVNAANYGAPQIRERVFLIGNRRGLKADFPAPRYSNRPEDGLPEFMTLGDAIGGDFHDPAPEVMNFSERKLRYLEMVPEGGNWRSMPEEIQMESMGKSWHLKGGRSAYWRRLSFAYPSPTVVTMPNHAGTSMCHPKETRAISVGEAAAIQEFPKDWIFEGPIQSKYKQIGNAVPVRLGEVVGGVAKTLLERIARGEEHETDKPSEIIHLRPHVRTRVFWKKGQAFAGDHGYYDGRDASEAPSPVNAF